MFDLVQKFINAWWEVVTYIPRWIFHWSLGALEYAIEHLPTIVIVDPSTLTSGFSPDMLFFLSMMEFDYGLGAVSSALLARFVLRRLPIIG